MKKSSQQFLKKAALVTALYLFMPESAEALTDGTTGTQATGIHTIDTLWNQVSPYLAGAFSVGAFYIVQLTSEKLFLVITGQQPLQPSLLFWVALV